MAVRTLLVVAAALVTSACSNLVYSQKQLFPESVATLPFEFRSGLWAAPHEGCQFDPAAPLDAWPDCANGQRFGVHGPSDNGHRFGVDWAGGDARFIAGDPIIMQSSSAPARKPFAYFYWGIGVDLRDDQGRAKAVSIWFVQCGPPSEPHRVPGLNYDSTATRYPLPGLRMHDDNCLATSGAAVRSATAASRAWGAFDLHWVRDEEAP